MLNQIFQERPTFGSPLPPPMNLPPCNIQILIFILSLLFIIFGSLINLHIETTHGSVCILSPCHHGVLPSVWLEGEGRAVYIYEIAMQSVCIHPNNS
jgi:hypothetical protein